MSSQFPAANHVTSRDFFAPYTSKVQQNEQTVARKLREIYPEHEVSVEKPSMIQDMFVCVYNAYGVEIACCTKIDDSNYAVVKADGGDIHLPLH